MTDSDTRIYHNPHYHSDFQYSDGFRSFDTTLSFNITSKFEYVGHDVEYSGRRFELWSPNADRIPVYPGTPPSSFSMVPPLSHPRVDGSGGRFDWTLVPQHLDANKLHHPFIMKPENGGGRVEFEYITSQWQRPPLASGLSEAFITGLLRRAEDLEENRISWLSIIPEKCRQIVDLVDSQPSPKDIIQFRSLKDWEKCVGGVTHIQRLLREKNAWLRMVSALRASNWTFDVWLGESISKSPAPVMGSWVNGGKPEHIQWLLHVGVPCYVIHQYRDGVDFGHNVPESRSQRVASFCPSDTWHLQLNINAYETIALRKGTQWADEKNLPPCGISIRGHATQLALSASHAHSYTRPLSDRYIPPNPATGSIYWPSEIVHFSRVPWFRPPPVRPAWTRTGKWSRFAEEELETPDGEDTVTVMKKRGHKFTGDGTMWGPYYDREHGRQLFFCDEPGIPEGVVNASVYGQPVPHYSFVELVAFGRTKLLASSTWMYLQERPDKSQVMLLLPQERWSTYHFTWQVGNKAPVPYAEELPLYSNIQPSACALEDDEYPALDDRPPTPVSPTPIQPLPSPAASSPASPRVLVPPPPHNIPISPPLL
jgi:hypothetical protein